MKPTDLKYAMVKQDCFEDLYCCNPDDDPDTKVRSTIYRIGQASLFTKYNADLYIVKEEKDPECQSWRQGKIFAQKSGDGKQPAELRYNVEHYRKYAERHKPFTRKCEDIDWGQYDVVISHDIAVPVRITAKYPKVLWCYMIQDHHDGGVELGYDVRFTQHIGGAITPCARGYRLDFPYTSVEPRYLLTLVDNAPEPVDRKGVFKEPRSFDLDLMHPDNDRPRPEFNQRVYDAFSKFGPVRAGMHGMITVDSEGKDCTLAEGGVRRPAYDRPTNHLNITLRNMSLSKYWVKSSGRPVRGNSTIEAISCRCLCICPTVLLIHYQLLHDTTKASGLGIIPAIQRFEDDPALFSRVLDWQEETMKTLAINKPMESLANLYLKKVGKE